MKYIVRGWPRLQRLYWIAGMGRGARQWHLEVGIMAVPSGTLRIEDGRLRLAVSQPKKQGNCDES
jgi:hypothetical protein